MSYSYYNNKLHLKGLELEIINAQNGAMQHKDGRSAGINQSRQVTIDASKLGSPQVQSDWNQVTTTAPDFIKNKPVIINNRNKNIPRTNATTDVLPTATEFPAPILGDTATVTLTSGVIEFYNYNGTAWAKSYATTPVTLDGNNAVLVRTNNTAGVLPTALEIPTPINGDTADVYLLDGTREVYAHNGTAWALIKTILPTALDGNDKSFVRTNSTQLVAPTVVEVPTPINGDTAKIQLLDGVIEFWSYNGTVWTRDFKTAPSPLIKLTRAALIAQRDASTLIEGQHYLVTDHVQGRLVAGTTILVHALSNNELSENAMVNSTYDNDSWTGIYDADRGLVLELQDNRNNIARGISGNEVANFDWGNVNLTNVVVDNATLTVTYGNTVPITNVTVEKSASLNLTGFLGAMNNMTFSTAVTANFTNANGTWRLSTIRGGGTFNASGYTGAGDNYYNEIDGASNINISNSSSQFILRQSVINASAINHIGVATGAFNLTAGRVFSSTITHGAAALDFVCTSNSHFLSGSFVQHETGTMTLANILSRGSTIRQLTTAGAIMTLSGVRLDPSSTISNLAVGSLLMTNSTIESNSVIQRLAGATGTLNFNYSVAKASSSVSLTATNTGAVSIGFSELWGSSSITHSSAVVLNTTRLYMKGVSGLSFAALSAGTVTITDTEMLNGSISKLATSTAGNISISGGTKLESAGFIQVSGTGNLTVFQSSIIGSSGINITAGNRNYEFTRLVQTSVARVTLSGTGATITDVHNEFEMHYRGTYTNSCTGAANTINYCEVSGLSGALSLTGTTGGSNMNRIKIKDGTLSKTNNPNAGTYQLWNISDSGIVALTNHAANETINYLDVSNQGNITINRTGLGTISVVQVRNGGTLNITGTSTTISRLDVEQGSLNFSAGSISNVSKKMSSVFTINGGNQSNVYHWNAVNKTTTVNNTSRIDYLGVVSSAPIV